MTEEVPWNEFVEMIRVPSEPAPSSPDGLSEGDITEAREVVLRITTTISNNRGKRRNVWKIVYASVCRLPIDLARKCAAFLEEKERHTRRIVRTGKPLCPEEAMVQTALTTMLRQPGRTA